MALISRLTVWVSGQKLTAAALNSEFNNIINNLDASNIIAVGTNLSGLQSMSDPGDVGSESLPSSISDDIKQLRFEIDAIKGGAQWYSKPADDLATMAAVGEVKMFHTFNGTVSVPRKWMILNGDVVNQTNYDAIHGSGAYVSDGVASSAILSKNLPAMASKYPVGANSTTQSGSSAITYVGNSSNQVNLQHDHTMSGHTHGTGDHSHKWYSSSAAGTNDGTWSSGVSFGLFSAKTKTGGAVGIALSTGGTEVSTNGSIDNLFTDDTIFSDSGTDSATDTMDNALSTTQSIQPHSCEFIYIMRVI